MSVPACLCDSPLSATFGLARKLHIWATAVDPAGLEASPGPGSNTYPRSLNWGFKACRAKEFG